MPINICFTNILIRDYLHKLVNMRHVINMSSFVRNYVKAGTPYMEVGCDAVCKSAILCRLLVSDTSDRSICATLL